VVNADVNGATVSTVPVTFTTAPLPAELQDVAVQMLPWAGMLPETGYYLVATQVGVTFAVDGKGVIRWYREFDGRTGEAKMQADGTFTTFVGYTMGWQPIDGVYTRYAPDGTRLGTYMAATPDATEGEADVYTDDHDFVVTKDAKGAEHVHMIAYELRPVSSTNTTLGAWHLIQRQAADGTVEFEWKSWSRFMETDSLEQVPGAIDIDHMNALSLDPTDGNYIASVRNMDAVVKIDASSGKVLWQVGGNEATMKVEKDPLGTFYGQHDAHVIANGNLLLFDNGVEHTPNESRAAEYAIDTKTNTATLVWEFRHHPAISTPFLGAASRLSSGNTLVAFSAVGVFDEVDPSGNQLWEGQIFQGKDRMLIYRILPLPSLYAYVTP
jgi:hypothetical protein